MKDKLRQGETLFADGKIEEAEKCFLNILEQDSQNKEALNNLGVIAFQGQEIERAIDYFDRSLKLDPFYKDAVLNYAYLLKELGLLREASPYLHKIIEEYPNDKELKQILNETEMDQKPRIKLAILCLPGLESFLGDIVDFLKTKYNVLTCYSNNNKEIELAVQWADIVWLDWANEIAIFVTNQLPISPEKRVICRIRSYEVFSGYLPQINWSKISRVVYVAHHVRRIAHEICPSLVNQPESLVIKNGVVLDKFKYKDRESGFNLAVVASINHKKNPPMWVEILSQLVKMDSRYRLKIAGEFQDMRYAVYFRDIISKLELKENIQFFGHVKDIPKWFEREDINYLLSTSIFESFGYNIAEAMAMGVRPLIHNFPGAEELWPIDCLFNTVDELIEIVRDDIGYNSKEYRAFIEQRYPPETQLYKFDDLLKELINENHSIIPQSKSQIAQELKNRDNTDTTEKSDSEIEINHHSGVKVRLKVISGDHMSRTLLTRCFYEQSMLEYIYENYEPGLNFVDVGGHIGNHTVFFSVVCKANRVDTFEPNPLVRKILEENISINHIDNTFLHGIALGASDANGTLEIGPWPHSGMTKVKVCELGDVAIRPLDSVIKESVDILKIDVEGMAGKVLMGGKRILADSRPALFVECAYEKEFNEVMSVVQPFGYRPKRRFNATPTIFFEYDENVQMHKVTYDQAVQLAT